MIARNAMSLDVGALLRLRNGLQEALAATPAEQGSAWQGLVDAYEGLRGRASQVIGDAHAEEFERLFPAAIDRRTAGHDITHDPGAMFVQQEVASDARTRIASLAGWLNGFIEEAQFNMRMQAEADAYAKERVRTERGVGFKPS